MPVVVPPSPELVNLILPGPLDTGIRYPWPQRLEPAKSFTQFLAYLDQWREQLTVAPKTRKEYEAAIGEFAEDVEESPETLRGSHVQRWIAEALIEDGLDAQTVNKKLSGLHSYWNWLVKHDKVRSLQDGDTLPFRGHEVKNSWEYRVSKIKRQRFAPTDVVRLWQAVDTSDPFLAAMIKRRSPLDVQRECLESAVHYPTPA